MPPPLKPAELPDRVLPLTVSGPKLSMPPPEIAELLARVLSLTDSMPLLIMPPPLPPNPLTLVAELPYRVHSLTASDPYKSFMIAPPLPLIAMLSDRVLVDNVKEPGCPGAPLDKIPPPPPPPPSSLPTEF